MTMIRPETEMKNSGIEWMGNIPKDWDITKLGNLGEIQTGNTPDKSNSKYYSNENGVLWVKAENLGTIYPIEETSEYITEAGIGLARIFDKNTVFVCCIASIGKCGYSNKRSSCNQQINGISFDKLFWKYGLYMTIAQEEEYLVSANGNVVKILNTNKQKMIKCPMPPLSEQQAIADYLDETCSKINEIIAEAKASIDEYKELKQSVIFEAVTKGLDKNVEMKDSGYDFIGDIPSKWEMCKVRHLGTAQNGISIGGDAFGSGHSFVSYGDVYKNYSLPKTVDKLVRSSEEDRKRYSVEKGDWFFTRTSETIEEVGFSCVCEETIPDAVFAGFLIRVRPFNNRIYTGFAKYYFRSNHLRTFFVKEMNLVTRASLAQGLLKDAPVVVPPYDEQIEIANYLENKCKIIDGVIKDKESTINDLEAYKKSLIYEVVTGKRRVV